MSRGQYRLVYDCPEVNIDFYMMLKDFIYAFLILSTKPTDEEKPLHCIFKLFSNNADGYLPSNGKLVRPGV